MNKIYKIYQYLRSNPHRRAVMLALVYSIILLCCHWIAMLVRYDFSPSREAARSLLLNFCWQLPLKLFLLAYFGQMYGIMRYFSLPDFGKITAAMFVSSAIIYMAYLAHPSVQDPRGIMLLVFVFSIGGLTMVRLGFRSYWERRLHSNQRTKLARVVIIGAGDAGAQLAREMLTRLSLRMTPVFFVDDSRSKWGLSVHGIPVKGGCDTLLKLAGEYELDKAVLAMPSATPARIGEIVKLLNQIPLPHETVPSLHQLASGQVSVSRLRPIDIEDLLGREMVDIKTTNAWQIVKDKVVIVTGAGGSIGSELCRQIAEINPQRLLLLDRSEPALFQIEQELISLGFGKIIKSKIADILDKDRMRDIFSRYRPAAIFHAAAHKHVPMMEYQPGEAIKNNLFGTACIAALALEFGLEHFVHISTDKAINPTNVMGATKRMAEIYLQSFAAAHPGKTRFMAVRFGNVLGSSGSVIPTFKKQIAAGGPVTVTDPEMRRYFMTIPEAVGLVLQSVVMAQGGEIFMLDMGEPVKIADLARQMIELSGYIPDEDIKIEFTGLRPGEKLFEELRATSEDLTPTAHPKIARYITTPAPFLKVNEMMDSFLPHISTHASDRLKEMIRDFVPEYKPFHDEEGASVIKEAAGGRTEDISFQKINGKTPEAVEP
jgi:FlaA1/EpsC-like NDP-sugar epimerase